MNAPTFLRSLQARPYEQRIRLLWLGTAVSAVVVGAVWWGLSQLFPAQSAPAPAPALDALKKQFEDIPTTFPALPAPSEKPSIEGLPADYRAVALKNFSINKERKQLLLTVTVNNPSGDILVFLNQTRTNLTLVDGGATLSPLGVTLNDGLPFPVKILSKRAHTAQIIFPLPKSPRVTLRVIGLYFETQPSRVFSEALPVELAPEVRGSKTISLPRE